ncbi:hypothetical protein FACS1894207_0420 [Bacteroidia bacterium]|nr:hypothetical protein FACS1894207_0420 [Bacteroidia bacterium]
MSYAPRIKSRILSKQGKTTETYDNARKAFEISDSIKDITLNTRLDEFHTLYELDRHIAEKQRNRNYFLFALAGVALLLILVTVILINRRKIRKKNKTLVLQIHELQEWQKMKENELLQKTTFQTPETDADDELCPESRKDKFCLKLRDLLLKEKIYRDDKLSRDSLTERLAINRYDLEDAFKFCFGMSYSECINELRLNDAVAKTPCRGCC